MAEQAPAKVNIIQGQPSRISVAGERYRFGIVSTDGSAVRITVLHDGVNAPFTVRAGDEVEVAGLRWSVAEVDVRVPGDGFVQLVRDVDGAA